MTQPTAYFEYANASSVCSAPRAWRLLSVLTLVATIAASCSAEPSAPGDQAARAGTAREPNQADAAATKTEPGSQPKAAAQPASAIAARTACLPGAHATCSCAANMVGSQVCDAGGEAWSDCQCDGASAATVFSLGGELSRDFAATGMLLTPEGLCTATLVEPDIILTAAHCLYQSRASEGQFIIGIDSESRARSVGLTEIVVHPAFDIDTIFEAGHDVAVARLSEPIDDIAPAILYLDDATALVGNRMRLTGYGSLGVDTDTMLDVGAGVRRSASVTMSEVEAETLDYDIVTMGGCHGDSGGPAFLKFGDAYAQVGIMSWGNKTCNLYGRLQRIDIYRDWLESLGVHASQRDVSCIEDQSCDGQCEVDPDCLELLCPEGSCTAPSGECVADHVCDPACGSADSDCNVDEPDQDPCEAYGLNDNGECNPQCPNDRDCAPPDDGSTAPESCTAVSSVPGTDGWCYHMSDQNVVCTTVALQTISYDAPSNQCLYFDAEGQNCGFTEAFVSMDKRGQCVYVDAAGQECGRRWADCTAAECHC